MPDKPTSKTAVTPGGVNVNFILTLSTEAVKYTNDFVIKCNNIFE